MTKLKPNEQKALPYQPTPTLPKVSLQPDYQMVSLEVGPPRVEVEEATQESVEDCPARLVANSFAGGCHRHHLMAPNPRRIKQADFNVAEQPCEAGAEEADKVGAHSANGETMSPMKWIPPRKLKSRRR